MGLSRFLTDNIYLQTGVLRQKKNGDRNCSPLSFFTVACGRYYFSLTASQPLGTVMVDVSLPACFAAFTSILY